MKVQHVLSTYVKDTELYNKLRVEIFKQNISASALINMLLPTLYSMLLELNENGLKIRHYDLNMLYTRKSNAPK